MNRHTSVRLALVVVALTWGVQLGFGQSGSGIGSTPIPCVVGGKSYANCTPGMLRQAKREAARRNASPQKMGVSNQYAGVSPATATMSPLAPATMLAPTGPPPLVPAAGLTTGQAPDYFGVPNYANSPLPVVNPTGGIVAATGMRKFVDTLPPLCALGVNDLGQCIPLATPDTTTFPGNDFYRIGLREYQQQMHKDLPAAALATRLRGYVQLDATNTPIGANQYLGPLILATRNRPVRILFRNMISTNLNVPVDLTYKGAGPINSGAFSQMASQKRATLHLHGGNTPWISDGTTHQWITPTGGDGQPAALGFAKGYSFVDVPDMIPPTCVGLQCVNPAPSLTDGLQTFYWTNKQSGRLMFYHDHAFGITRLNVYAGEAAGYLLVDGNQEAQLRAATVPGTILTNPDGTANLATADLAHLIPLVIQDKTFVPDNGTAAGSQLAAQDPTWDVFNWGGFGNLWFPHVYTPNQNPADLTGANGFGRWDWGPWFFPPQSPASLSLPAYPCTSVATPTGGAWAFPPLMCPGVPDPTRPAPSNSPSGVPEGFMDTMVVNGTAYPSLTVDPTAYRFQVLSVGNDRTLNMGLYVADPLAVSVSAGGSGYADPPAALPAVIISGCTAATATAVVEDGSVVRINVAYPATGPGCTGTPTVSIAAPPAAVPPATASQAYAIASVNTEVRMVPSVPATARPATLPNCPTTQAPTMAGGGLVTAVLDPVTGNPINNTGLPLACWPLYNSTYGFTAGPVGENGRLSWGNSDGREGGLPDPTTAGPPIIQIGTEGGLLPAPTVIPSTPVSYDYNKRSITVLNVLNHGLYLGPAERADIIVDFSAFAGKTLLLYNDAPAPVPGADPRIDYYTNDEDYSSSGGAPTTMAGYGPNTRTVMQIVVRATPAGPLPTVPFSLTSLTTALPGIFSSTQDSMLVPEPAYPIGNGNGLAQYSRIQDTSMTLNSVGPLCAAPPCVQPMLPKAIQELFTLDYGRMNATLGVELPLTNFTIQTTIPYGYADPPTELFKNGEIQIWKITHNGVDTHFMHFHLFNVQVINRVGWDGSIKPPDPNELSFKDTVRMNPLEDIIVALKPLTQDPFPFPVPNSVRPLNVTAPVGTSSAIDYTNVDPTNQTAAVVNDMVNFGWEYVWHCHILGHEENDMMRAMILAVAPNAPANLKAVASGTNLYTVTWTEAPSPPYTGFTIQRSLDPTFPVGVSGTASFTVGPTPLTYSDTVPSAGTWYYRLMASNLVGYTRAYAAPAAGYPNVSSDSAWSGTLNTAISQMISPTPGSTLLGTSVTFTWTAGTGVSGHELLIGTTLGASDVTNALGLGTATSYNATLVGAAPGATLYVRLRSLVGATWFFNDYTYTAPAASKATMITPTPGSTLTAASTPFTWTSVAGATQYSLFFGSTPGASDVGIIYLPGTSYTATLPVRGAILYVRLWTLIGGVWQYIDYSYTEATLVATMVSPVPGSTLAGASTTFTWTAGTGVTLYSLFFGSTPGASDLGLTYLAGTSYAATLPVKGGTVFVRLWSFVGGVWQYIDYIYTEATLHMVTPVPGTTLTNSSVTFTWAPVTGATQYSLWFGSTPGASNLGNAYLTGTSYAATLPAAGAVLYARLWLLSGGAWQYVDYTYTEASLNMLTPVPGSTLPGASVTFTWAPIGASLYSLFFGSTPGASDLGQTYLTGTSYTATVPVIGATLYVRLWGLSGGAWQFVDYTYTEASVARMSSPTPGTTLAGTSILFTWTAGTGATQYSLFFGSTPGASDLGLTYLAGTSYAATLPVRGATLYVRLWSLMGGVWQYVDYTYTH